MQRRRFGAIAAVLTLGVTAALSGCGSSNDAGSGGGSTSNGAARTAENAPAVSGTPLAGAPEWCGSKQITFGLLDGFGGNSWRLITTASGEDEVKKCPSVTKYLYADGQGDTQKAISDINSMVAQGVNAMVVFPDAGKAILPALRSAYKAGVVTVPYRSDPGGQAGTDYTAYVASDPAQDAKNWTDWIKTNFPDGAKILMLSGPPGNTQGEVERQTLNTELADPKYEMIGTQPYEVTNWDPAQTQQVLTAAIAKYPQIDVIVSDFGPSLVGALPEFSKSGRSIPAVVASDGNVLSCFYEDQKPTNPDFELMTVATGNDNIRLAIHYAVAMATGGVPPTNLTYEAPVFEDSVSGKPNGVKCDRNLPADVYLSAEMPGDQQAALLK
jgi:ribose transport system substrate-binding protein